MEMNKYIVLYVYLFVYMLASYSFTFTHQKVNVFIPAGANVCQAGGVAMTLH